MSNNLLYSSLMLIISRIMFFIHRCLFALFYSYLIFLYNFIFSLCYVFILYLSNYLKFSYFIISSRFKNLSHRILSILLVVSTQSCYVICSF